MKYSDKLGNIRSSSFENSTRQANGNDGAFLYPFHAKRIRYIPHSIQIHVQKPTVEKQYNNNDNDNNIK